MIEQTETLPATSHSVLDMVAGSGPVVQLVLISLIVLSIWSWAITVAKALQFRKARSDSDAFTSIFWETRNFARIDDATRRLEASPLARVFSAGYKELLHLIQEIEKEVVRKGEPELDSVERALKRAGIDETAKLEKGVTFLATVASAAPFIGLFGTVWGIMNAFHGLGQAKATTIQAVAPGISEALVATAIGLAAAIPAAIAYNYFAVATKQFRQSMEGFCSEFLNVAKKSFPK